LVGPDAPRDARAADFGGLGGDLLHPVRLLDSKPGGARPGQAQSRAIGAAFEAHRIPVQLPALSGPVYRARDTAELAFGPANVRVTDDLLADDYAGARLGEVLAAHAQLFRSPVPPGANRVLVGHRTPATMVLGEAVGGRAFPEGAAIVIEPVPPQGRVLGIWKPAPIVGAGFHAC
jgi:phosphohistidine phosphatase SixA